MAAYVGDRPGDMYLVPAIHTQLNATQMRIDELLVDEQGKVRPSTESAIVDLPTKRFRISNAEGKVRLEGTYGEFVERGRAIMASGKANGAAASVVQAYADLSCAGCREGGTFMVAAGCGAVVVLGALACGPAAPACAVLIGLLGVGVCAAIALSGPALWCCANGFCGFPCPSPQECGEGWYC
jgi:hypothetical protein